MAVASLVFGILSLLGCWTGWGGIILAVLGVVFGIAGRKDPNNSGLATGGLVCSIIALIPSILFITVCAGVVASLAAM